MEYPYSIELIHEKEGLTTLAGHHTRKAYAVANAKILLYSLNDKVTEVVVTDDRRIFNQGTVIVARWKRNAETNLWERLTT